jgi:prevent-host-death family protein
MMATMVDSREAPGQLASLLKRAAEGEEIIITHEGGLAVRLVPISEETRAPRRTPGTGIGKFWVSADFDAPLPEDAIKEWYEPGLTTDRQ